jgi:hypothetical protein
MSFPVPQGLPKFITHNAFKYVYVPAYCDVSNITIGSSIRMQFLCVATGCTHASFIKKKKEVCIHSHHYDINPKSLWSCRILFQMSSSWGCMPREAVASLACLPSRRPEGQQASWTFHRREYAGRHGVTCAGVRAQRRSLLGPGLRPCTPMGSGTPKDRRRSRATQTRHAGRWQRTGCNGPG